MVTQRIDILLSLAVIVLSVLAIVVYIISGAGAVFYALFIVTAVVMLYTWYQIGRMQHPTPTRAPLSKEASRKRSRKKR